MNVDASCSHCGEPIEECDICGSEFEPEEEFICVPIEYKRQFPGQLIRVLQEYNKMRKNGDGKPIVSGWLHICQECSNEAEPELS